MNHRIPWPPSGAALMVPGACSQPITLRRAADPDRRCLSLLVSVLRRRRLPLCVDHRHLRPNFVRSSGAGVGGGRSPGTERLILTPGSARFVLLAPALWEEVAASSSGGARGAGHGLASAETGERQ
jgi:hypothetical protein